MQGVWFVAAYMIITNIIGFALMGIDKRKARNGEYRISEKTLWFWAVIGGGTGSFLGMKQFRHKTKHAAFKWGLPILMILQIGLLIKVFIQL
ncbi:hypothetical protein SRABI80_02823 [Peribacillus frigoritolerans]|uniref:DUF1294 domain-containing protein n=1 Tax=Peribacillus frigoritolerans TaxID=450367 RepID=UPI001D1EBA6A|nr:DUF1294 domain-containing protein [Peribacillus frigoritolerans]CAH0244098.1 hypothetical protein SRABI80_02823 [Peribacillus frigoritolerans]